MEQSKKARAFELFSQGYVPLSPEVKDLGLHPSNRYKYFYEWEAAGKPTGIEPRQSHSAMVSTKSLGGETIGSIDETKAKPKNDQGEKPKPPETLSQEEQEPEGVEEDIEPEEAKTEEPPIQKETIGGVSEAKPSRDKDEQPIKEKKIATLVPDEGIKCIVFLSKQTLVLHSIAAATQAELAEDGDGVLLLGDFLDTCAEDFFRVRGKKLGLISSGGQ